MTDPSRNSVVWYSAARMATAHSTPPESMLYIVHAAADRDLAILLRARIKDLFPGLQVFLASKPARSRPVKTGSLTFTRT